MDSRAPPPPVQLPLAQHVLDVVAAERQRATNPVSGATIGERGSRRLHLPELFVALAAIEQRAPALELTAPRESARDAPYRLEHTTRRCGHCHVEQRLFASQFEIRREKPRWDFRAYRRRSGCGRCGLH